MVSFDVTCPRSVPTGLLIMREQCKRPRALPMEEALQAFTAHDSAVLLSASYRTIGKGSSALSSRTVKVRCWCLSDDDCGVFEDIDADD